MDHRLQKSHQSRLDRNRNAGPCRIALRISTLLLGGVVTLVSLLSIGCQSYRTFDTSANSLPAPPPVLDRASIENIRYQSPGLGGPGRRNTPQPSGTTFRERESEIVPAFNQVTNSDDAAAAQIVKDVIITGNRSTPTHHLTRTIRTRPGRYFDPDKLQQDVNMLWRMPEIEKVKGPFLDKQADGITVRIEIVERSRLTTVAFVGNRGISDRALKKKTGLTDGSPMDVHEIRMAKTKIEELYRTKGFPRTQVEILDPEEGKENTVTFLIHEDQQQRVWKVDFEGNSIATEARLRTVVKSKPGIMKVFGGLAQRDQIEQDVTRLTTYYRSLGYFNAQIGREISESNDGRWLTLRFIINEGPRYKIRSVRFIGNKMFQENDLKRLLTLLPGEDMPEFNSALMREDLKEVRDLYGSQGFVFADVNVETRFLEEPGQLDLVYKINEGKQYRVGQINIHYENGNSVTKSSVVRNRISLRPGDVIDMREIDRSKTKLSSSQIFATGGGPEGSAPSIVVKPRELRDIEAMVEANGLGGGSSRSANRGSSSGGSGYR